MKKILMILFFYISMSISHATDIMTYKGLLRNDISFRELLPIFTKKQKFWESGQKITVFIKPLNSIEHSIFASDWLGISTYRYKKKLKKQVYSGKTNNVKIVLSDEQMISSILSTPYSIGYLTDGTLLYSFDIIIEDNEIEVIYHD